LRPRLDETQGSIEIGELPIIEADPLQMRQLLENLLDNALKFHRPEHPPLVRLRAEIVDAEEGVLSAAGTKLCRLSVEDNGVGFDEGRRERMFAVFGRLSGADERRGDHEGMGMGLPVCRRIAERHGGGISAHSQPGKGATFVVTLPLSQVVSAHLAHTPAVQNAAAAI
jgi:signal transduction histidine kinase